MNQISKSISIPGAKITASRRHYFTFDPDFHPERAGQVALIGWHSEAIAEGEGIVGRSIVTVGLNQRATEASAREFAQSDWITKWQAQNQKR